MSTDTQVRGVRPSERARKLTDSDPDQHQSELPLGARAPPVQSRLL